MVRRLPDDRIRRHTVSNSERRKGAGTNPSWMVVRKSRTIIGGYRVIAYGLTEDAAQRRASRYKTPHEAMNEPDLMRIRLAALRGYTR
jgi:hypothetical protein